jgi:hypothetical protein
MMRPAALRTRACSVETQREALNTELQGAAVELALAAPFLSLRDLARWRARVTTWQRRAAEDAALLGRLNGILGRYTAGRP